MALNANAMTTVAKMRAYLARETTAATDGRLDQTDWMEPLINRISSAIETYCDRRLIAPSAALTYTLDGDGKAVIRLPDYPIVSITSVTLSGSGVTVPVRPSIGQPGYVLTDDGRRLGHIYLEGYGTDVGRATNAVVAVCGYDATTAAGATTYAREHRAALDQLENACLQWASLIFNAPVPSAESVATESLTFAVSERRVPSRVEGLLAPFRRWSL